MNVVTGLWLHAAILLASAVVIYLSCEFFVNGVEWVGHKLDVGQKATGTILAAFGTALPESAVTLVAVAFSTGVGAKQLGVGAALGGPLALSTVAYATVGITMLICGVKLPQTAEIRAVFKRLSHDQGWFLGIFVAKVALGTVVFAWKPWLAIVFVVAYGLYVRQEMRGPEEASEGEIEPLKFQPGRAEPSAAMAGFQTLLALVVIFAASRSFVTQLEVLGPALGLKPQVLALLFSPIATELPETMNAIIWVRQGKYRLALANISGAMMIQATIPSAIGLIFTPWLLSTPLLAGAGVTMLAIAIMFVAFRRGSFSRWLLAGMGLLYLAFVVAVVLFHMG